MPESFNVAAALGRLKGRFDAWQFVRDFAAAWATPIIEADGVTAEELDAAEERLGLRLPAAVREAYLLFGRRSDLTSHHGTLYRLDALGYDRPHQMLVFRAAHQGVAFYGVPLADSQQEDPPVGVYVTMMDKASEKWLPFMDRFSSACVDMLLWERAEAGRFCDGRYLVDGEPASLVAGLAETVVPRYAGNYGTSHWYADADIILRVDDDNWTAVGARTEDALDAFRAAHPGRWLTTR
jgi:cell wall assembly regulator SMI1